LGNAISAHIPQLQAKLGDDLGLNASVAVNQFGGFHPSGHGQSSPQNDNLSPNRVLAESVAQATDTDSETMPASALTVDDGRLDIRV
jgi:hypothetical protein